MTELLSKEVGFRILGIKWEDKLILYKFLSNFRFFFKIIKKSRLVLVELF